MDLTRRETWHVVPAISLCIQAELVSVDPLDHGMYAGALFLEPIHVEHTFSNMLMPGPLRDLLRRP